MAAVYCPTVSPPQRLITYGGQEIGEVPRSESIESATPIATRVSPNVAIVYLVRIFTALLFII